MLPNLGDGSLSELKKGRQKFGKAWGKVKRATGIKKGPSSSSDAPFGSSSGAGFDDNATATNTFQRLEVSSSYDENLRTLTNFYHIYNPRKVSEAKAILDAYKGREEVSSDEC